jgi:hypothetical protein
MKIVRDGEPVRADIAGHVGGCEQCSAALAALSEVRKQLRRLPDYEPPSHSWAGIERQLRSPALAPRRTLRWRATVWRAGTAAGDGSRAGCTCIRAADWADHAWEFPGHRPQRESSEQQYCAGPRAGRRSGRSLAGARGPFSAVFRALGSSARLRPLPSMNCRRASRYWDLQLSSADESGLSGPQAQQLWSQRVQLLNSLVSVRYAEQAARGNNWPSIATGDI